MDERIEIEHWKRLYQEAAEQLRKYEHDNVMYHKRAITKAQIGYNIAYNKATRAILEVWQEVVTCRLEEFMDRFQKKMEE
jgi:predicted ATPase